jgi:pSer/pThr/pTyr-binding forkhead associated (FHA) protein
VPVRLRYLAHDLEVPEGEFVVGRTSDCQLSLDDPLVSRKHALLTVRGDSASVEDLNSRNGVLVNGIKITAVQPLKDGDVVRIGSQDLRLFGVREGAQLPVRTTTETRAGTITSDEDREEATSIGLLAYGFNKSNAPPDRRIHALSLIGGVADKSLAMGRTEEAERVLFRALLDILDLARKDAPQVTRDAAEAGATYALKLAAATGRGRWVDYTFELYDELATLMPAKVVDQLYAVVRKVKSINRAVLQEYIKNMRGRSGEFGPNERFVQQRVEGLERFAP